MRQVREPGLGIDLLSGHERHDVAQHGVEIPLIAVLYLHPPVVRVFLCAECADSADIKNGGREPDEHKAEPDFPVVKLYSRIVLVNWPVLPKPLEPRSVATRKLSTIWNSGLITGTITSCAMRSQGSILTAVPPTRWLMLLI